MTLLPTDLRRVPADDSDLPAAQPDMISSPPHYTSAAKCDSCGAPIECIQISEHQTANLAQATQYIWRCDMKGTPIEDLKKAAWFLARELRRRGVQP